MRAYLRGPLSGFRVPFSPRDSLRFSLVPQREVLPFVMRKKKKGQNVGDCSLEALDLLLTNAIGSEEKLFVSSIRKKPILSRKLEVIRSPLKFQSSVRRAFQDRWLV